MFTARPEHLFIQEVTTRRTRGVSEDSKRQQREQGVPVVQMRYSDSSCKDCLDKIDQKTYGFCDIDRQELSEPSSNWQRS